MKKLILAAAVAGTFLASCTNKASTTGSATDSTATYLDKIKQTALTSLSGLNSKDVATVTKDIAPTFVDYGSDMGKPVTSVDTLKAGLTAYFEAFPDYKGENLHATAADSTVVVTGLWSGTFKKEFMKLKPTNKSFKLWDADVFTFNKDGKINSHRSIQMSASIFYQLGITTPSKK